MIEEKKIKELISNMTLEEKALQLTMKDLSDIEFDDNGNVITESLDRLFQGKSCGVLQCPFLNTSAEDIAKRVEVAQEYLSTKTSSKIKAIPLTEGLHGVLIPHATVFPQSIALGCMWNDKLIKDMASAIALEASSCGVKQILSPVFDVIRDQRWGRVEECYGEDPYLVSRCGVAFVEGAQGDIEDNQKGLTKGKVACTAKHFIGYSLPLRGMNLGPTLMGKREIYSTFLEPFEKAISEANIYSFMPSYSEIDGVPTHANRELLTSLLRDELGFKGYVISDYLGITMLTDFQKTAINYKDAALQAFSAGVDLEAPIFDAYKHLEELVNEGKIPLDSIDKSVFNVLKTKALCGLLDTQSVENYNLSVGIHDELALKLAEESIVLLENKNNILPLDSNKVKKIAVIGPNGNNVQFGDYSWTNNSENGTTIFGGLQKLLTEDVEVKFAQGSGLWEENSSDIPEAIELAKWADVVILALGETSMPLGGVGWDVEDKNNQPMCGEGFDVDDLELPKCQMELLREIAKVNSSVATVMLTGRAWVLTEIAEKSMGLIQAFYPGQAGGLAIAKIILGLINPSGRLSVSMPRSVGQMPMYYNHKPSSNGFYNKPGSLVKAGRDYVFESPYPLYEFGYGLSYTNFEYSNIDMNFESNGNCTINLDVKNIGKYLGSSVIQLYINDKCSSVTTPNKVLRGFKKVSLNINEVQKVTLNLTKKDFMLINREFERVLEAGEFEIMLGNSSNEIFWQNSIDLIDNKY